MFSKAELVTIVDRIEAGRDPTDDKFLELAVSGQADMIVTGDLDLLVLHPFRSIPIIDPAAFIQGVEGVTCRLVQNRTLSRPGRERSSNIA
ncbi:MAG TPA: putative toxin-antitoxin system toxin component, PIN family [Xanthobacteraceae bacterium]|nr:putative toxin-antitoxin system toxin component, PIN family [Xanthobacteraceae bacterium]